MNYIVVQEDEEGLWYDDPEWFSFKEDAIKYAETQAVKNPVKGYDYSVYECQLKHIKSI